MYDGKECLREGGTILLGRHSQETGRHYKKRADMTVGVRPKNLKKKYLSIVWMSFHRRPFTLSQLVFRGPLYFLGYKIGKNKLLRPVEYVLKFLHTLGIIFLEKPSLVIVQSPPAFAPIAVMFYSLFTRLQYAVDAHTSYRFLV